MPDDGGFKKFWGAVFDGDLKEAVNVVTDGVKEEFQNLKNSRIVQQNIAREKPVWDALLGGDLKGAGQAYIDNVKQDYETLRDIENAKTFQGKIDVYNSRMEQVMSNFRDNCGEHIQNCEKEICPPSAAPAQVKGKQPDICP